MRSARGPLVEIHSVLRLWGVAGKVQEARKRVDAGGTGQAVHGFPCRLREMDFLNIPGKEQQPDATAGYSPSWLIAGFWGHPCPQIAVCRTEY